MNEFVLVEFISEDEVEFSRIMSELGKLGDDFDLRYPTQPGPHTWSNVFGKIRSSTATFLALQNPFLAERMRISYIPDEMKDKYRNR